VAFNTCRVAAFAMALRSRRAGGPHAARRGQRQRAGVVQRRGMGPPLHLRHHQGAVGLGVGNLLADRVNHILLTTLAGGTAMASVVNYNSL
jgi:hypothetical protein